jgi:hypothetical protein
MRRQLEDLSIAVRAGEDRRVPVHPCRHPRDARDRHSDNKHRRGAQPERPFAYTLAAIKDWTFILGPGFMVVGERV